MDEITRQARQGSMAALIQLMNERLADDRIRTRAMFDDGVLQILCESATVEPLEQAQLVPRLKALLDELSPRNFRRIRLNARIAREQQLLWLEEIKRDPENQLLWSQDIQLTPPNLVQQLVRNFQERQATANPKKVDKSLLTKRSNLNPYWQGLGGGVLLCLLSVAGLWGWWRWQSGQPPATRSSLTFNSRQTLSPSAPNARSTTSGQEPFVEAIRLAETSAIKGQTAKTAAEWLDLAAKWQRASDLMQSVPDSDPRSLTARERVKVYRANSEMAQKQAQRLQ